MAKSKIIDVFVLHGNKHAERIHVNLQNMQLKGS